MRIHAVWLVLVAFVLVGCIEAPAYTKPFPVAPHDNVTIEWWYVNAHVTTKSGRHLAVIASFFRFGNAQGQMAMDSSVKTARQSHYLIWAVTDEDKGIHDASSLADKNTLLLLQQAATLRVLQSPKDAQAQALLSMLDKGGFPPPTQLMDGSAKVVASPFSAQYGATDSLRAAAHGDYRLTLSGQGAHRIDFTFESLKPSMYVGGNGDTGIYKPTDMHYVSLTRCQVTGAIDGDPVTAGQGWFDHQWGDSWTTERVGWDWWGVQLENGTDILFFRQRDLATGRVFMPLATFEDKQGHVTVTKNIQFEPDPKSLWTSPRTGVTYPLDWKITFPDRQITLTIHAQAKDQEMPVLANGGAIWEGTCSVVQMDDQIAGGTSGVAYQELVGYGAR